MAPSVLLTKVVRAAAAGVVITILPLLALLISRGPKRIDSGPDAGQGMWGAKTASANWCEADYVVTPWIAEFWNSMSSLLIVVHSMYGLYRHAWACEARYAASFTLMAVVGCGSFLFHSTLWRSMQLADELPMVWTNATFFYIVQLMEVDPADERRRRNTAASSGLITLVMTVAIIFLDSEDQTIFLLCYGGGVVFVMFHSIKFNNKYNQPIAGQAGARALLMETSVLFYMGGFVLWLCDRLWCPHVRWLNLHMVWHICASLGTSTVILFWVWTRGRVSRAWVTRLSDAGTVDSRDGTGHYPRLEGNVCNRWINVSAV